MNLILVGAGGHAKAVVEAVYSSDFKLAAYVDPKPSAWLSAVERFDSDDTVENQSADGIVLGLGAVSPEGLEERLALFDRYRTRGWEAPSLRHSSSVVSEDASMQPGSIALAASVVQPGAQIGEAAIVNTSAIVEHDSRIGRGAHVAPGAIVLGACDIGEGAMVGAGAVVLPGSVVPPRTLVPALSKYSG